MARRDDGARSATGRLGYAASVLVFYAACLAIVLGDIADGKLYHHDVDNEMRVLQIRHLLSGAGSWFDLALPFIQSPEVYVSPWSRLVDLPYVALARTFGLVAPQETALQLAFLAWPPVLLLGFCALAVATARRLTAGLRIPPPVEAAVLVAMAVTMVIGVLEFAPGRIDHHNVQIVAMLAICLGLVRADGLGGALVGAGSAVSIVIGLECLPLVVLAYAILSAGFLFRVPAARTMLISSALAMAPAILISAAAFLGPAARTTQCDAFSAPYIVLPVGFSLLLAGAARFVPETAKLAVRLLVLAVGAFALLAAGAVAFPACLAGPYAMIDPLSRTLWFDRIWQEHSFLYFYSTGLFVVGSLALMAMLLVLALPFILARLRSRDIGAIAFYLFAAAAFVLTLVLTRYVRFPAAIVPVLIPAIFGWRLVHPGESRAQTLAMAGALVVAVGFAGLSLVAPVVGRSFDAVDYMAFDECKTGDIAIPAGTPPGRIVAPLGLSMPLVAALPGGFSVAAVPFHRAAPGMKRVFEAFTATDPDVRRAALAPFDYVAVCRFPLVPEPGDAPFYAALSAGGDWPGLTRVDDGKSDFQLFRIDHALLR
jgi:hypothetical protein